MRKLTVLLIAASLVYIAFAGFLYFSYPNWVKERYLSYPEEVRPYIDFAPFSGSREFVMIVVGGAIMSIAWVLYLSRNKKTV